MRRCLKAPSAGAHSIRIEPRSTKDTKLGGLGALSEACVDYDYAEVRRVRRILGRRPRRVRTARLVSLPPRARTSTSENAYKFGGLGRSADIRSAYPTAPFGQETAHSKIHWLPGSVIDGCLRVAADAFLLTPFSVRCKHLRMLLALVWLQSYFHVQAVRIYGFGFRHACHQTMASASRAFPSTRTLRASL